MPRYMDIWCNTTEVGPAGCRSAKVLLVVELSDGRRATLVTRAGGTPGAAGGWVGRQGPRVYQHEYHGEVYDAAREVPEWSAASAAAVGGSWAPAIASPPREIADGVLEPMRLPPMRKLDTYRPVSVTKLVSDPRGSNFSCNATRGTLGGVAPEGQFFDSELRLACTPGTGVISEIRFANFGAPSLSRDCAHFSAGSGCAGANSSRAVVEAACLGKASCSIRVDVNTFGYDPCPGVLKRLAVVAAGCESAIPPTPLAPNVSWLYDFGQNLAGVTELRLRAADATAAAAEGAAFWIRHAEGLNEDGSARNVYCANSGRFPALGDICGSCGSYPGPDVPQFGGNCANQTNLFVPRPGDTQDVVYSPLFTGSGFRYAQLYGGAAGFAPDHSTLVARFVHTDVPVAGNVRLGAVAAVPGGTPDVLNAVHHIVLFAQRSNLWSIPTDCPQRERRGWLGDAHVSSNEAALNHDMRAFYRHYLRLIRDDQLLGCQTPLGHGGYQGTNVTGQYSSCDADACVGALPDVVPFTTGPYGGFCQGQPSGGNPGRSHIMSSYTRSGATTATRAPSPSTTSGCTLSSTFGGAGRTRMGSSPLAAWGTGSTPSGPSKTRQPAPSALSIRCSPYTTWSCSRACWVARMTRQRGRQSSPPGAPRITRGSSTRRRVATALTSTRLTAARPPMSWRCTLARFPPRLWPA